MSYALSYAFAPDIQEAVLNGLVDGQGAEMALRALANEPFWAEQRPSHPN